MAICWEKVERYILRSCQKVCETLIFPLPGVVARSDVRVPGMWKIAGSILTSVKIFFR